MRRLGIRRRQAPSSWIAAATFALTIAAASAAGEPAAPFADLADAIARDHPDVRAIVVARGACVVFEYYRADAGPATRFPVYSIAKSALAILVGIAIDRGALELNATLGELLPEAAEAGVDPRARTITVRDLLTMTSGFDADGAGGDATTTRLPTLADLRRLLARPMTAAPGDHFAYDGDSVELLSLALSRAIRGGGLNLARRALFAPLAMTSAAWSSAADGRLFGQTDLFLSGRDMAKLGLLTLRHGRWGERQVVSAAFVAEATARHNSGGPPLGAAYGYLWWVGKTKNGLDAVFAAGSGGQLVYVAPRRDLVVSIAASAKGDDNLALVNDVILPTEAAAPAGTPCLTRLGPD